MLPIDEVPPQPTQAELGDLADMALLQMPLPNQALVSLLPQEDLLEIKWLLDFNKSH
jgi:hypothetical protein